MKDIAGSDRKIDSKFLVEWMFIRLALIFSDVVISCELCFVSKLKI